MIESYWEKSTIMNKEEVETQDKQSECLYIA